MVVAIVFVYKHLSKASIEMHITFKNCRQPVAHLQSHLLTPITVTGFQVAVKQFRSAIAKVRYNRNPDLRNDGPSLLRTDTVNQKLNSLI